MSDMDAMLIRLLDERGEALRDAPEPITVDAFLAANADGVAPSEAAAIRTALQRDGRTRIDCGCGAFVDLVRVAS